MSIPAKTQRYFAYDKQDSGKRYRLFCFPYAGGGVSTFCKWSDYLPQEIELCPAQFPGRDGRLGEKPFDKMEDLIDELAEAIYPLVDLPFAFFGHSMGALISYALTQRLQQVQGILPTHLFVSGRSAPNCPSPLYIHQLPDGEFVQELRNQGGIPEVVFNHKELMQIFLPILRADFTLNETYKYEPLPPLGCPITVFGGLEDPWFREEALATWFIHSSKKSDLQMFPGNHMFVNGSQKQLVEAIVCSLSEHSWKVGNNNAQI